LSDDEHYSIPDFSESSLESICDHPKNPMNIHEITSIMESTNYEAKIE
jgi:hypothetical protein